MKMNKLGFLMLATTLVLVGCSDEEVAQRKITRVNYDILDTYEYDKVKVVVEEEMTSAQLAEETLRKKAGLSTGNVITYDPLGIAGGQGIFVETAIADGSVIPTKSGFSDKEIETINNSDSASWEKVLAERYSTLEDGRKKSLESLNENIDTEAQLEEEIMQAAEEQKTRIAEQEKALEEQRKQEEAVEKTEEAVEDDEFVDEYAE